MTDIFSQDWWIAGFVIACIVLVLALLFSAAGMFIEEANRKEFARLFLASLFIGPVLVIIWPVTAAAVVLTLIGVAIRWAVK